MGYIVDDSWDNCGPVLQVGNAAFGVYVRCGVWVARNLTDGFVPAELAAAYGSPEYTRKLVDAGFWEAVDGGYRVVHYLERNPPAHQVQARRAQQAKRNALGRDPALRHAIRSRDQDRCRYCGIVVNWTDRKGPQGGTYDHVDPNGPNSYDNLVVSCRACNSAKKDRTPQEAGMTLRAAPSVPSGTRIKPRSAPESTQGSSGSLSPPKGGKAAREAPRCAGFADDGNGWCTNCGLPRVNKIHVRAA